MAKNAHNHRAKRNKNDEFYTRYEDIENELQHYSTQFKGKKVYLNCDSLKSAFFHFFRDKFHEYGLKHLTATHYKDDGTAYRLDYAGGPVIVTPLIGDGAFDSEESIATLNWCDVVVSNPPFSLYRKYLPLLVNSGKAFLVVGPLNVVTYKEVFPFLKSEKVSCGVNRVNSFIIPDGGKKDIASCWLTNLKPVDGQRAWLGINKLPYFIMPDGTLSKKFDNIHWITNIPTEKKKEDVYLTREYKEGDYKRYDNYDAINVDRLKDIPVDYDGVMGVPITFLTKVTPEFEVVGCSDRGGDDVQAVADIRLTEKKMDSCLVDGEKVYKRVFIKRKPTLNDFEVVDFENNPFIDNKEKYKRILIKRKE